MTVDLTINQWDLLDLTINKWDLLDLTINKWDLLDLTIKQYRDDSGFKNPNHDGCIWDLGLDHLDSHLLEMYLYNAKISWEKDTYNLNFSWDEKHIIILIFSG